MPSARLILLSVLFCGCTTMTKLVGTVSDDSKTAEKATEELTPRQEYYLGRSIAASVLTQQGLHESQLAQVYVSTLGQYLVYHSQRPETFRGYSFAVVKDKNSSAMSAPGGFIFISHTMLKEVRSEDELAAVIAHEIAHIDLRHAEKIIQEKNMNNFWKKRASQGLGLLLEASGKGSSFGGELTQAAFNAGANFVEGALTMKFDKNQEIEADKHAVDILITAGYNPHALQDFISRLKDAKNSDRHPSSKQRISSLTGRLKGVRDTGSAEFRVQRLSPVKNTL